MSFTDDIIKANPDLLNMFQELNAGIEKESPLTRCFDKARNYRYYEIKKPSGARKRFCYMVNRNIAGYFLCYDEAVTAKGGGTRKNYSAFLSKTSAKNTALERYRKMKG